MILSNDQLLQLCHVAIEAASQAGDLIRSYTGKSFQIDKKPGALNPAAEVVTEVDRKSQDTILKHLSTASEKYDLGLLAEESDDDGSRFTKDYFWCIDPIDGTLPFVEKRPGYAVSIALVSREGIPHIGVVYEPLTQTLYHAIKGGGAFRNQEPWTIDTQVSEGSKSIHHGGAVMNVCWVLENPPAHYSVKPKPTDGGGCLWDYAATTCIVTELGAWASDRFGNPLELNHPNSIFMNRNGVLFATSEAIARERVL